MDFRILGPLEVWDGQRQLELGGSKRQAVLAFLLLHADEVVSVDRLVDQLWGERAPRNAAAAIRTHVSRLRKELGPEVVATRARGYVLRPEPGAVDLERFERLSAEAENLPARERAGKLREALALWRGPPLEDLGFEPALAGDIARLNELHLTVLENRIDADLEAGNHTGLVGELEALIAEHPLRERLRGQLILALYRNGRQAEALEVFRETRSVLAEELGLEPSPELRELERAILQHDPALRVTPIRAPVAAEPGVRPGRRRRIYLGASLALVLAGLGAATAYAIGTRTTHTAALSQPASITSANRRTNETGAKTTKDSGVGHATTGTGKSAQDSTTPNTNRGSGHSLVSDKTPTTSGPSRTTTTARNATNGHRTPKPVTFTDDFSEGYVDPKVWNTAEIKDGGDVSIAEQDGQLQLTIGADAVPGGKYNQIDDHIGTGCNFPFGFDARVDYTLLEWPPGENIDVGMSAIFAYGAVYRDYSSGWGDGYASWIATNDYRTVGLPDTQGSIRIKRTAQNKVTTYFWHSGKWKEITSAYGGGAAVIALQASSDGQNPFGGHELKVAFDNFKISAIDPRCT
jgi:DNA-binding SARP family transcriptional activator